jgi:hypothetical protein
MFGTIRRNGVGICKLQQHQPNHDQLIINVLMETFTKLHCWH